MSSNVKDLKFLNANRRNDVKGLECKCKTLTEQQWKDSCDVNWIVRQYAGIGMSANDFLTRMNQLYSQAGEFLDVSGVSDLSTYHVKYEQAVKSFVENVPSAIRAQFDNSPERFYSFVKNSPEQFNKMMKEFKNYNAPSAEAITNVGHNTVDSSSASTSGEKE